jgi:hypothetical protein
VCTYAVVEKSGSNAPLKDMEKMKPLMQMVFHLIDKMKRLKLSKEVGNICLTSCCLARINVRASFFGITGVCISCLFRLQPFRFLTAD